MRYNKKVRVADELVDGVRILLRKTDVAENEKRDEFARLVGRYGHRICDEEIGKMYKNTIIKIVEALRNTDVDDFGAIIRGERKLSFEGRKLGPSSFGPKSKETFDTILNYLRNEISPKEYGGSEPITEVVIIEMKEEIRRMAEKILRDRKIEDPEGILLADILVQLAKESGGKF